MAQEANGEFLGFGDSTPCELCHNHPGAPHNASHNGTGEGDHKKAPPEKVHGKQAEKQDSYHTKTGAEAGHNKAGHHEITAMSEKMSQLKAEHITSVYPPLSVSKHMTVAPPIIHDHAVKSNRGNDSAGAARLKICIGLGIGFIILALTIFAIWSTGTFEQKIRGGMKRSRTMNRVDAESDRIPLISKRDDSPLENDEQ